MTRILLTSLALVSISAQAQSPVAPHPNARQLILGIDTLDVYVVQRGNRQRTGRITDQLDTIVVNGETRLRRIYRTVDQVLGTSTDTLVDRFPDFEPRAVAATSTTGSSEHLTWEAQRILGDAMLPNKPLWRIDTTLVTPLFSAASFDVILRSSTIAVGDHFSVPSYSGRQGAKTLTAVVTRAEVLHDKRDTWRLDADYAGLAVTFWIEKTSHRLVQQSMAVAPGVEILFVTTGR